LILYRAVGTHVRVGVRRVAQAGAQRAALGAGVRGAARVGVAR